MKKAYLTLLLILFCFATNTINAQNNAIDLSGTTDYVSIPNTYSLNMSAFTIEFDFYMNALQNHNAGITATNGNLPQPLDFYVDNTGAASLLLGNGISFQSIAGLPFLAAGQWHHLAIVVKNTGVKNIKVYINGIVHVNYNFTVNISSNGNIRIGDRMDGFTNSNARYDNVRIWSVARASNEIADNYNNCLLGNSTGLDVYYNFENISGTTVADLAIGNGSQDGTIFGTNINSTGPSCLQKTFTPTTSQTTQIYTGNDKTLADLEVIGSNLQWYDAMYNGSLLPNSTPLLDNSIYYVSQTVGGVESSRLPIIVKRISNNSQSFCLNPNPTVSDLISTPSVGTTIKWYSSPISSTPLLGTDALNDGTYYIEQSTLSSIETLGSGFSRPLGVVVQTDGKILVADYSNNAVKRMNSDGSNIITLGSGFNGPSDIAVQTDGKILVTDFSNNAVKRMNSDGSNIVSLGSGFDGPTGIAVQDDGKIIVTNYNNNTIQRMDPDGSNIVTLGAGFFRPSGLAIQENGKILIADYGNNDIKTMTPDGVYVSSVGSGFINPYGVTSQNNGKILVADFFNNAVKRMDNNGENIVILGSGFNGPASVKVQIDGKILVSNYSNNTIKRITEASTSNRVAVNITVTNLTTTVTQNNVTCFNGNDGNITVTPINGVAPYTYLWSNNGTTATISNLSAGQYDCTITDANGCTTNVSANITEEAQIPTPSAGSPIIYNQNDTASALTASSGADGLLWYTTATEGTGSTIAPTPSTATVGTTSYWVSSTANNGCESNRVEIVVAVDSSTPATHLNFNGNNYIELPHFEKPNVFTIEVWVKNNYDEGIVLSWGKNIFDTSHTSLEVNDDGDVYYYMYDFNNDISNKVESTITINQDWHHIAVVKNANATNNLEIYIDGVLGVTGTVNINITSDNLLIGGRSYNNLGPFEIYNGNLDELRIWNVARTATEINEKKDCELMGDETGLLRYYKFNQGLDQSYNTALSTLTNSASGGGFWGTLYNFALSGSSSNWLAGSPLTSDVTCSSLSSNTFNVNSKLKIYPNPTKDYINIEFSQLTNPNLSVHDVKGSLLMNQKLNTTANQVNIQHLPSGVYVFKITSKEGVATSKVIKQ